MGRPAGASVLCLFPIPWPEAMVCIFRATAGSGQAGDLSSGFITARTMTRRAEGALRSGCAAARSRPGVLPAPPRPVPHTWALSLCTLPYLGTRRARWKSGFSSVLAVWCLHF